MITDPPPHLLYVDDEEILLEATRRYLTQSDNFNIDTASSAQEALGLLQHNSYDAIISDYQMPEMNGIAFLEHLREKGNNIPFILFTGKGREEIAIDALNAGADYYIQKGGRPKTQYAELVNSVRHAVERKRAINALKASQSEQGHLLKAMGDVIIYTDVNQRTLWVNHGCLDLLKTDNATIRGKPCYEVFWNEEQPCKCCRVPEVLATKTSVLFTRTYLNRTYQIIISPVKNESGDITNFIFRGTYTIE